MVIEFPDTTYPLSVQAKIRIVGRKYREFTKEYTIFPSEPTYQFIFGPDSVIKWAH